MSDYTRSQHVDASPDAVFDYVSDVGHLPDYLPPIEDAQRVGDEGVALQGELKGQQFRNEGYLRVDAGQRRMEWGADTDRTYSGHLTVSAADGGSEISVTLSFGPRSPEDQMQEQAGDRDLVQEALGASLESVRRQVEGEGGKVVPPEPPGPPPSADAR